MPELTIVQAAVALGVSDDTIRRRIKSGDLQARVGPQRRKFVTIPEEPVPSRARVSCTAAPTASEPSLIETWLADLRAERDRLAEHVRFLAQQLDAATTAQTQLRELLAREQSRTLSLPVGSPAPEEAASEEPPTSATAPRLAWWTRLWQR